MARSKWLLLWCWLPLAVHAQESADVRLLRTIYAWDTPGVTAPLRIANATAYPTFTLAPLGVFVAEGDWQPAVRTAAAEGSAAVLALGLKHLIRRERPYARVQGIALRSDRLDQAVLAHDDFGMPSGHATLAFAVATSWTMERPRWYVVAPAYTWATLIGLSRVWHGAHYPSDVLAGAALGTGTTLLLHVLWPASEDDGPQAVMPVGLHVVF